MKHSISTALAFFMMMTALCQTKDSTLFKKDPPNRSPAIFAASMPPCLIGIANQYGEYIGVSDNTLEKAKEFITEALAKVPDFKNQIREMEIQLMLASKEERYEDYEKLLHKISDLKIEASLFHEELVKRARKVFDKKDVLKLDGFINSNQDVFLKAVKL